jgi:hypothetical protein
MERQKYKRKMAATVIHRFGGGESESSRILTRIVRFSLRFLRAFAPLR